MLSQRSVKMGSKTANQSVAFVFLAEMPLPVLILVHHSFQVFFNHLNLDLVSFG